MEQQMLTPKQAAERVGVSVSLVYQWCQEGLFEYLRLGAPGKRGRVMIDPESFERFLQSCKHQPRIAVPLRHIKQ
jgi:excisionase family DNA binding protein